jgi:hypothetical protein
MLCQGHRHDIGKGNLTLPAALRWGEHGLILDEAQLPTDIDHPTQEVDVVDRETEDLTLPEPTTGAGTGAARNSAGWLSTTLWAVSTDQGTTRRRSTRGAFTDDTTQGFDGISPSSTAAERIVDRLDSSSRQ